MRYNKDKLALYMVVRNSLIDKGLETEEANMTAHRVIKKIKDGLIYERCQEIYTESEKCLKKER